MPMPSKKRPKVEAAKVAITEEIDEPTPPAKEEKPTLDAAASLIIANVLEQMTIALSFVPLADLKIALEHVRNRAGKYGAIGCMFDPFGMESKTKFYEQGIQKLEALVQFREAINLLEESRADERKAGQNAEKLRGILGL